MAALLLLGSGVLGLAVGWMVDLVARRVPRLTPDQRPAWAFIRASAWRQVAADTSSAVARPGLAGRLPARVLFTMLLTGVLFVGMAARFGAAPELPAFWLFSGSLVALSIIDLEQRVVPNAVLYPSALAGVALLGAAALASGSTRAALDALVGAATGFGALLVIHLAKPTGMGFGDVRLGGLIGLNVGFLGIRGVVVALFVAFLLVALAGGALVAVGRASRRAHVPFVPFLAAGALLTVGWGAVLVRLLMG